MRFITVGDTVRINHTPFYFEGHEYTTDVAGEVGEITDYFPSAGEYEVDLGYAVVYFPVENLDLVENVG